MNFFCILLSLFRIPFTIHFELFFLFLYICDHLLLLLFLSVEDLRGLQLLLKNKSINNVLAVDTYEYSD